MNSGKGRLTKIALLSSVTFLVSLALLISGLMSGFETRAFDLFSRLLNPRWNSEDIIIVTIDQSSIDRLSGEGINWPWPRQVYAPLIEYLSEADAVFIDILFLEPSSYGVEDDRIFSEAVRKASNVYLALSLTSRKDTLPEGSDTFLRRIAIKENLAPALTFTSVNMPIEILLSSVRGAGNVTIPPDGDGVYRKIPLIFLAGDYTLPHLVLSFLIEKKRVTIRNGSLFSEETPLSLTDNRLLLRYSGRDKPFREIPAADILKAYVDRTASREPHLSRDFFRGKKVFIGLTAAGLYDLKPTPISPIATGVSIHAVTLENIMEKSFFRPLSPSMVVLFMLIISLIVSFAVVRYYSFSANASLFLILLAIAILIPALLFRAGFYMAIIFPPLTLIIAFMITATYSYATEGKERRFVKRAFSQYMDQTLVDYVLKNPSVIRPGGQRRRVTIFFADIAGFTTIAERLPAEETAKILHTILDAFTEVIIQHKGVIDKYIGDAVMAFWGAPLDTEQDESNACRAALRCMDSLNGINKVFAKDGLPLISMRIGIHSGDAIVGNLGSDRLFDYTAVGDTVNLASRLESANKLFRTKIIVSGETRAKTGDLFLMRELGKIEVKGKSLPAAIYELAAEKESAGEKQRALTDRFHQGLSLFYEKRFVEAADIFHVLAQEYPDDGPSGHYLSWCRELLAAPELTEGWDIIKMTVK